jgi:hypothetical protein
MIYRLNLIFCLLAPTLCLSQVFTSELTSVIIHKKPSTSDGREFAMEVTCSGTIKGQNITASAQGRSMNRQVAEKKAVSNCMKALNLKAHELETNLVTNPSVQLEVTDVTISPFPENELRQCAGSYIAAKTQVMIKDRIFGDNNSNLSLHTNQDKWSEQCDDELGLRIEEDFKNKLKFIELAKQAWDGTPTQEIQDCLNRISHKNLIENFPPLAPSECTEALVPSLHIEVNSLLQTPNFLEGTGASICQKVIAANIKANPIDAPERVSCSPKINEEVVDLEDDNKSICKSKLDEELKALIKNDKANVLGLQFEVTSLKLALITQKEGKQTLEEVVRKKQSHLETMGDGTRNKIKETYRKYGKIEDQEIIDEKIAEISSQAKAANYNRGAQRFYAEQTSAFLLALQASDPQSGIDESDVAISWVMKQIQDRVAETHGKFSAAHNSTNFSNQVAWLTGYVSPEKKQTPQAIEERLTKASSELQKVFQEFSDKFKQDNPQCFDGGIFEATGNCWTVSKSVVPAFMEAIEDISEEIRKTDKTQIQMMRNMGTKVGTYNVYFNRLALTP